MKAQRVVMTETGEIAIIQGHSGRRDAAVNVVKEEKGAKETREEIEEIEETEVREDQEKKGRIAETILEGTIEILTEYQPLCLSM